MRNSAFLTAALFGLAACGGGEPAPQADEAPAEAAPAAEAAAPSALATPDWMTVDEAAQTVTLNITAGQTADNNYWNFNGFYGGTGEIVVPVGYTVTINFANNDPGMAHSIGVDARTSGFPSMFTDPVPAFEGGISANPTSLTDATMPGESEVITFVAATAGEYSLVCYIPAHALTGMYVHFTVSAEGEAGVRS
jgi:FtsP/CotA-like multicopper oxidase with cupredoxin domain